MRGEESVVRVQGRKDRLEYSRDCPGAKFDQGVRAELPGRHIRDDPISNDRAPRGQPVTYDATCGGVVERNSSRETGEAAGAPQRAGNTGRNRDDVGMTEEDRAQGQVAI